MKKLSALIVMSVLVAPAFAEPKSCETLKSEIATKLDAKGVKNYTLEVVAAADVKEEKVVGSCEAGSKKITYKK